MCFGDNFGTTVAELKEAFKEPDIWKVLVEHRHNDYNRLWVVAPDDIAFNLSLSKDDDIYKQHPNQILIRTYRDMTLHFDSEKLKNNYTACELVRFLIIKKVG